jgi:mannose-6-phosphate isomerase-like protein (cupin superfamily)
VAFGFFEISGDFEEASPRSEHEQYFYICSGTVGAEVGGERKQLKAGDIAEVPRGTAYRLRVSNGAPSRFIAVRATPWLEAQLDASERSKEPAPA